MEAYPNLKAWKPGQSGNLNGRPVGSRTAFSAGFLKDLAEIWSEEGRGVRSLNPITISALFSGPCSPAKPQRRWRYNSPARLSNL